MIKLIEAFAGIGSQAQALKNLGLEFENVGIFEIDKYAIKSYEAIHGEVNILGDICNDPELPDFNLFTYSFPCQDISVAGKQRGLDRGGNTRSGLLWECEKIITKYKPKYLLLENVKNLISKKHKPNFDLWLEYLESLGYSNYWKVLNAKDYGIPQNRERVFVVSILGEHAEFNFPEPLNLELKLKDMLENTLDDKYYLADEISKKFIYDPTGTNVLGSLNHFSFDSSNRVYDIDSIGPTISTFQGGNTEPKILVRNNSVGERYYLEEQKVSELLNNSNAINEIKELDLELPAIGASRGRNPINPGDRTPGNHVEQRFELNKKGVTNTITTVQKDNYVIEEVRIKNATKKGYLVAEPNDGIDLSFPDSKTKRGRVQSQTSHTLTTKDNLGLLTNDYRIRKLTPKECWRLMGFSDEAFGKAKEVNSNTQLYKQAGNSIVVNVLMAIFAEMFKDELKK